MKLKKIIKTGEFVMKHHTTRKIAGKIIKHEVKKKIKDMFK